MSLAIDISTGQRMLLLDLVRRYIPGVEVWAYGSRVKWTARPNSDLDLVAFATPEQGRQVSELKDAIAESDLPFLVDLHIWDDVPEQFHKTIRTEHVVLQEAAGEDKPNAGSIPSDWEVKTIAECAAPDAYSTQIGPFGKALMASEYVESGIPVLRGTNVNHGRFYDEDFVFIRPEAADRLSKFESTPGDVLLVHKGSLGHIGIMPSNRKYERYIMGNSMMRVKSDKTKLLPEFLYYWLTSEWGQQYIFSRVSQVGVPQIQTPLTTLRKAELAVPPVIEQHAITAVLGALDDRIESVEQTSKVLEEITRAIFKSWFVDFDPVRAKAEGREPEGMDAATAALFPDGFIESDLGEIPAGWQFRPVRDLLTSAVGGDWGTEEPDQKHTELVSIIRGTDMPKVRSGGLSGVPKRYVSAKKLESRALADGDIVIEVSGGSPTQSTGRSIFITDATLTQLAMPVVPASFCRLFRPLDKQTGLILAQHLSHIYAEGKMWGYQNQSTGISNFQTQHFLDTEAVCIPSPAVLTAFHQLVSPIVERQQLKIASTLGELRDTLLPRLISGRLRVPEAEKMVEAVL